MDSKLLRACVAELIGTFALVFVGGGAVCVAALTTEPRLDATAIALAEGLTLAVALAATHRASGGGLNPALTLMLWAFRRIDGRKLLGFVVAQLLGALLAGHTLRMLFPTPDVNGHYLGTPHLLALRDHGEVTLAGVVSGVGVEIFFTALVAFAFYAMLLDRRGRGEGISPLPGGLIVGLAQAVVILFGCRLTGGAANPARWLGTVVWEITLVRSYDPLSDHTVYWVGPIIGALLGGFLYVFVLQPPEEDAPLTPAPLPRGERGK